MKRIERVLQHHISSERCSKTTTRPFAVVVYLYTKLYTAGTRSESQLQPLCILLIRSGLRAIILATDTFKNTVLAQFILACFALMF